MENEHVSHKDKITKKRLFRTFPPLQMSLFTYMENTTDVNGYHKPRSLEKIALDEVQRVKMGMKSE